MQVHALVLETPNDEIVELRALYERGQVDVDFVEPVYALSFPLETLDEDLIHVVCLLYHLV